jgi:hypothetical protein
VPTDLLKMYEDVAHPKFFLVVSGGNSAVMKTHGLIREAIGDFINIAPTNFTLGTPPTAANGTSPALWLATSIPDHLAQAIVDVCILSSSNITLFALPYDLPVIGFVGIFAGFTLPNTTAGADLTRDLLRTAIKGNKEITQFVQTHRDAYGPLVSAEQAWEIFLVSVSVQSILLVINNTNTVAWCLYVDPSTTICDSWFQMGRLFGKVQVMMACHGMTQLHCAFRCKICPSVNHPTPHSRRVCGTELCSLCSCSHGWKCKGGTGLVVSL